jgi:hypothetical protein
MSNNKDRAFHLPPYRFAERKENSAHFVKKMVRKLKKHKLEIRDTATGEILILKTLHGCDTPEKRKAKALETARRLYSKWTCSVAEYEIDNSLNESGRLLCKYILNIQE